MRTLFKFLFLLVFVSSSTFYSCTNNDDDEKSDGTGIPSDNEASSNPSLTETNTVIPNALFTTESDYSVININLTGIQHPVLKEWVKLYGTKDQNQNVWVEVDGVPKGVLVLNMAADNSKKVYADLVFLVDNSGSMGQEADSVANGIVRWATDLSKQGLDIQFGCVGYESGVDGALGLSNLSTMNNFLNRKGRTGVSRTKLFAGTDSLALLTAAKSYQKGSDECGSEAARFADENFSFRSGANRIYVNFTDEPNQPGGLKDWSVEYFADQKTWNTAKGTIHTVFSGDTTFVHRNYSQEKPWLMSKYTGGTKMFVPASFNGVTLNDLPVTGALANSYIIKFKNTSAITDGNHTVKVTILSSDNKVKAQKVFENVKFGK